MIVTFFENQFSKQPIYLPVAKALQRIQQGKSKVLIEQIRQGEAHLKKQLPAICFSGKFDATRKDENCLQHSNLIILDFDKVKDLRELQTEIINHSFIFACWVSPSGNGLKALVKIANGEKHREHFAALKNIFPAIDKSGVNQSRLCYESYDTDIYINDNAIAFTETFTTETKTETLSNNEAFANILKWLQKKGEYFVTGNRSNYIFKIASACCRFGIDEYDAKCFISAECSTTKDFTINELTNTLKSAYRSNKHKFGTAQFDKTILVEIHNKIEVLLPKIAEFPLHVFPQSIQQSILDVCEARSLAINFVATTGLWTISSLAGTRYHSDFNGDSKNILFVLMIAPVSVGKTPAFKVMCEQPLKELQEELDKEYERELKTYNIALLESKHNKTPFTLQRPRRYIPIAKDGTTEGYISKSMVQPNGIGVYQDEAETILNAGSFKSTNDAISFFTQAFSGGRLEQIRADEAKERVVPNLNLNLLMGTQPTRLKNIFTEDRISSGFASRFLIIDADYQQLNENIDPFASSREMCNEWKSIVQYLFEQGNLFNNSKIGKHKINITECGKDTYKYYFKLNLKEANKRITNKEDAFIIGTEAKMSAYFPRLTQILAILYNPQTPTIDANICHLGYELYKYYAASTINILFKLTGEIETGLSNEFELIYSNLPQEFTRKDATEVCQKLGFNERKFDIWCKKKDFKNYFHKVKQGIYLKI